MVCSGKVDFLESAFDCGHNCGHKYVARTGHGESVVIEPPFEFAEAFRSDEVEVFDSYVSIGDAELSSRVSDRNI